jgi:hypothetical protein
MIAAVDGQPVVVRLREVMVAIEHFSRRRNVEPAEDVQQR